MRVIITGASRGMGKGMAEKFASAGHEVLISARNQSALDALCQTLMAAYPPCTCKGKAADVTRLDQVQAFGKWCLEQGEPDILINNAGIYEPGKLLDQSNGLLEGQLAVNLYSAYHLTRVIAPAMVKRGQGHIINICSIAGQRPYAHGGAYSISKYALNGFSQNLREELKPTGVKVTTVYPGAVLTDSWGDYDNSQHRIMEVSDIAQLVYQATQLSVGACVEEIVVRPRLGDL
ncbi:MAG: SDR family oxidoreductase [Bacteroidetes bacterium]|nr:SDR family oxidoreductase [Bacteroidota bacterium]